MIKRGLLSLVSSIFDPLGILSPATIEPKQIIQLSWQRKIDWYNPLPLDLEIRWKNWLINLSKINHICLSHCYYFLFVHTSCIELHIFVHKSPIELHIFVHILHRITHICTHIFHRISHICTHILHRITHICTHILHRITHICTHLA